MLILGPSHFSASVEQSKLVGKQRGYLPRSEWITISVLN